MIVMIITTIYMDTCNIIISILMNAMINTNKMENSNSDMLMRMRTEDGLEGDFNVFVWTGSE